MCDSALHSVHSAVVQVTCSEIRTDRGQLE